MQFIRYQTENRTLLSILLVSFYVLRYFLYHPSQTPRCLFLFLVCQQRNLFGELLVLPV